MRIRGQESGTRSIVTASSVRWVRAALCAILLGVSQLSAQSFTGADSAAPSLRSFKTDSQAVAYLRHSNAVISAVRLADDSIKAAACGSTLRLCAPCTQAATGMHFFART